jgi:hypothetical protein
MALKRRDYWPVGLILTAVVLTVVLAIVWIAAASPQCPPPKFNQIAMDYDTPDGRHPDAEPGCAYPPTGAAGDTLD